MTQTDLSHFLKKEETEVSSTSLVIFQILFCYIGDCFQADIMESLEDIPDTNGQESQDNQHLPPYLW